MLRPRVEKSSINRVKVLIFQQLAYITETGSSS